MISEQTRMEEQLAAVEDSGVVQSAVVHPELSGKSDAF